MQDEMRHLHDEIDSEQLAFTSRLDPLVSKLANIRVPVEAPTLEHIERTLQIQAKR